MAVPLLDTSDLDRLGKLCGMFGSAHDGERAAAAAKADQLVRLRGGTWPELLEPLKALSPPARSYLSHRSDALRCLAVGGWSDKELSFLRNMSIRRKPPTPGQEDWLADLVERATGRCAA